MATANENRDTLENMSITIVTATTNASSTSNDTNENIPPDTNDPNKEKDKKKDIRQQFAVVSLGTWLQTLLNISVPLMIGVFTIVIMKNNQDMIKENRLNDLEIARLQREEDRLTSFEIGNETALANYIKLFWDIVPNTPSYPVTPATFIQTLTSSTIDLLTVKKKQQIFLLIYRGYYLDKDYPNSRSPLRYSILDQIDLNNQKFVNFRLAGTRLNNASFVGCVLTYAYIGKLQMIGANFTKAKLKNILFEKLDLSFADLTGVEWTNVILMNVNLTGAIVSDELLSQTLSLEGTILPNGTLGQGKNLITNGDGTEGLKDWFVNGTVQVATDFITNVTYFYADQNATMQRTIKLTDYQMERFPRTCCISLEYNDTIIVSLSSLVRLYYGFESIFVIDTMNGSRSEEIPGMFSWTGCRVYDEKRIFSIDLQISFVQKNNISRRSKFRAVKFFLRFEDWISDPNWI